ncbi:MAG: transglutaminase-like domain-containing protein [Planctomycetota bacterium]|jgi:hypothetical protein
MSFGIFFDSPVSGRNRRLSCFGSGFVLGLAVLLLPAEGSEEYRAIRYGEMRVGYVKILRERENREGKSLYKTTVERNFSYFQGKQVQYTVRETYLEDKDGALKEVAYLSVMEQGRTTIRGTIEGGKISYLCKYPDKSPSQSEADWGDKVLGPNKVHELIRSKGLSEGTRYSYKTYSFAVTGPASFSVKVAAKSKVLIDGREREATRVVVTGTDLVDGNRRPIPRTRWYDSAGALLREEDPCFGLRSETSCSEDEASGSDRGVLAPFTLAGACRVSGKMIRPSRVSGSDLLLSGTGAMKSKAFKGPGQAGGKQADGVRVTVRLPKGKKASRPCADAGKASALEASYFLDFDQGDVEATAKRIAGGIKDSGKAAEALRRWTYETLKKNPVNNGMATASTALKAREGDALEHAVVLAAMCRAVGIPARVAGGLKLAGGLANVHVWTEVWAGTWVPLDATQDRPCDAARIRFAASELKGTSPDAVLFELTPLLQGGKLSVRVNGYQIGGLKVDGDDPNKGAHEMRGNAYKHRFYGFGFMKPAEFKFQEHLRGMPGAVIAVQGNRRERVLIRAGPSSSGQTLRSIIESKSDNFVASGVREMKVGGMPALVANMQARGGGYGALTCYIHAGDTILTLECTGNSSAARGAFEQVMKTMRFE